MWIKFSEAYLRYKRVRAHDRKLGIDIIHGGSTNGPGVELNRWFKTVTNFTKAKKTLLSINKFLHFILK